MYRVCFTGCLSLAVAWSLGCSSGQNGVAPAANVTGTITLDGKAVPNGELHFGMTGVPPRVLPIKDGTFSGEAPVGKNQVELFIYAEGPPSEKSPGVRSKYNIAPPQYWGAKTTLEATVEVGGANEFNFPLTSR